MTSGNNLVTGGAQHGLQVVAELAIATGDQNAHASPLPLTTRREP